MRLDATSGAVTLTVNFIDKPVELGAKRTLVWSLMPAPVKDISWYYKYDLNTANGIDGWTPKGTEYINEKVLLDGIKRHKEGGITHYLVGGGGPPFHADVWMRGYNTNGFQQLADTIHNSGMKFVQYNCFVYHNNGDESKDFGSEMVKHPLAPYYESTYWYNPEGPFVDFWIAGLKWNMHKYGTDGTYLDGMPTTGIHYDPFMDQGYIDAKGDPHGKWPIFALRSWAERMYTMMHETERKDGIVYQHDSGMIPNLAIVSFADIRCGGEEAPSKERLLASWPLDEYLVKYDERMYGIPVHTLWYNWWKKPIKENQVLSVTLLCGQLINKTGVAVLKWNINSADYEKETTPHIALLRLLKGFDVYSATWIPFWRSSGYVTLNPSTLKASMYLHPGKKALVIVSNLETQPAVNSTVTLNLKQMGFSGAVKAKDAFLGTEFKVEGQTIKVDVQEERYRLLLIENVDRVSP
jgi:hypothetical protein